MQRVLPVGQEDHAHQGDQVCQTHPTEDKKSELKRLETTKKLTKTAIYVYMFWDILAYTIPDTLSILYKHVI